MFSYYGECSKMIWYDINAAVKNILRLTSRRYQRDRDRYDYLKLYKIEGLGAQVGQVENLIPPNDTLREELRP